MKSVRIATRKSPLALWQSDYVAAQLRHKYPDITVELVPMSTRGDEIVDRSLAAIGGKGLFLKELEQAMMREQADCAVHSLKDVPMELEVPFALPAILPREDPADAFICPHYPSLEALPIGARVGTSSLRRQAQLRALRPDLQLGDLRGNVNTRLAKLDAGHFDAIILACVGLERLGLADRIGQRLNAPAWLPAPAQAAIAVECRQDNTRLFDLLAALDDPSTRLCVETERAMNRALRGSCHVPVGALAHPLAENELGLQGLVGGASDGRIIRAQATGKDPETLGQRVAQHLLEKGAGELLARCAAR